MKRSRRILSGINYALGVYVLLISIGFVVTLHDVRELIEVHQWHGCWEYRDYSTYLVAGAAEPVSLAVVFFVSWRLLKSVHWKFAILTSGIGIMIFAAEYWSNLDC
jgi:hypothetical protein